MTDEIIYKRPPAALVAEWEEKLKAHGLAESQQAVATETTSAARGSEACPRKDWRKAARKSGLDGCAGEIGRFSPVPTRDYKRLTPDWVLDNAKVAAAIKHVFPALDTSAKDRASAARWAYVLYQYFRALKTAGEIARHFKISTNGIEQIIIRAKAVGKELYGGVS